MREILNNYEKITLKNRFLLLYSLFKFPWFVIHELSHIMAIMITGSSFEVEMCEFMKIEWKTKKDFNIIYYDLTLMVEHTGSISMMFIACIPTITFTIIQLLLTLQFLVTHDIWFILLVIYGIFSYDMANMSQVDIETFKTEYKSMFFKK